MVYALLHFHLVLVQGGVDLQVLHRPLHHPLHHYFELIELDRTVAVLVHLLDDLSPDLLLDGSAADENLLDLVGRDGATAILVEEAEGCPELLLGEQLLLIDGRHDPLAVIDVARLVHVDLREDLLNHVVRLFEVEKLMVCLRELLA